MSMMAMAMRAAERLPLSDRLTAAGVDMLCARTKRRLQARSGDTERLFVSDMRAYPIAAHVDAANEQHYELPAEFFSLFLGPQRKYSSCLYPTAETTLAEAEGYALAETAAHADIRDGMDILELGCGWGSLSLYLAQTFPNARITSVSNSASQRDYILRQAELRGIYNLDVITADMNAFATENSFDRVVSVEMFEHMSDRKSVV